MQDNPFHYSVWFEKAEDDERAVRIVEENDGPISVACFHSQQMAEKYLKGLLVYRKIPFSKTHDLWELGKKLHDVLPQIDAYKEDLLNLNQFYIETGYPGD